MLKENQTQSTISGRDGLRTWLYPREVKGFFIRHRRWVAWVLIFIYLSVPWIHIKGEPLFLLDVLNRKMILGGVWFWPQDLRVFLPLIISTIFGIIAITSLFGRIWCGWACPQTVFLHFVFEPIERLIEGKALTRKKNNSQSISTSLAIRKFIKHLFFLLFSLLISNSFIAYFWGIEHVLKAMSSSPTQNPFAFGVVVLDTLLFYAIFAWFKEQACIVICPYARLQSTLYDEKTLIVGYDEKRGEPRRHASPKESLGDCVNCQLCVQVCPTGIDIRDGLQLECIGCAKCIDACDKVMTGIKKPTGLIRYASLNTLLGKGKESLFKLRFWIYTAIIIVLNITFIVLFSQYKSLSADLTRTGTMPYFKLNTGEFSNIYTLRVRNKSPQLDTFQVKLIYPPSGRLQSGEPLIEISPGELKTIPINLTLSPNEVTSGKMKIELSLFNSKDTLSVFSIFLGPRTQNPGTH